MVASITNYVYLFTLNTISSSYILLYIVYFMFTQLYVCISVISFLILQNVFLVISDFASQLSYLANEEKEFEGQYSAWLKQYEDWKIQNQSE